MSNKKTGNDFEQELCQYLFERGYWVHNFASKQSGQPADIIAVKNYRSYLIDAKVCSSGEGLRFSRIEPNQIEAMTLWNERGNGVGWFACKLTDDMVYMICLDRILEAMKEGRTSLPEKEIRANGVGLGVWAATCGHPYQRR